ncbi:DgyrCDS9420 [Dimorphilus gyrociliatus]|uniref:DgyrCDS9420 n=1 Tax=Dimorphilus gyrociliatus TaxID=2664684 RepID=A0A7I8VZM5_9ANNE|nr:DgyrCDS9420 [Dimorphilus gyrociliatus]
MSRFIEDITSVGFEKEYEPKKHYIFLFSIGWSDKTKYVVYRTYKDFLNFHVSKKLFRRMETRKFAEERSKKLEKYSKNLMDLRLLEINDQVSKFFTINAKDLKFFNGERVLQKKKKSFSLLSLLNGRQHNRDGVYLSVSPPIHCSSYEVIADYTKESKDEKTLKCGQIVDVVQKSSNGWWLVQIIDESDDKPAWVPASYLQPTYDSTSKSNPIITDLTCITIENYNKNREDELSFEKGVIVKVNYICNDGWWMVSCNGQKGLVPAVFLRPFKVFESEENIYEDSFSFDETPL